MTRQLVTRDALYAPIRKRDLPQDLVQNQKAVAAYFSRKQLLPFGSVEQQSDHRVRENHTTLSQRENNLFVEDTFKVEILFWNKFHGRTKWWLKTEDFQNYQCGQCSCNFMYNKSRLAESDAVLFEYNNNLVGHEKYMNRQLNVPESHLAHQYWILYSHEAEAWEDRNFTKYNYLHPGTFNLSANYRRESDIVLKYGECLSRNNSTYSTAGINYAANKIGLIVWLVSNCRTSSKRMEYVKVLKKYINVDIFGKCAQGAYSENFNHRDFQTPVQGLNAYKFYLAFENTFCEHYITEKIFKILQDDVRVVPVVMGAGPYKEYLPAGSYIDTADFLTPQHLARYLHILDKNDTLYNEFFKPREKFICYNYTPNRNTWPCSICNKVCYLKQNGIHETLEQHEIDQLFLPSYTCYYP